MQTIHMTKLQLVVTYRITSKIKERKGGRWYKGEGGGRGGFKGEEEGLNSLVCLGKV